MPVEWLAFAALALAVPALPAKRLSASAAAVPAVATAPSDAAINDRERFTAMLLLQTDDDTVTPILAIRLTPLPTSARDEREW